MGNVRERLGPEDRVLKPYPLNEVVILGMGGSVYSWMQACHKDLGPFVRERTEVWAMNYGGAALNVDLIWNMHDLENYGDFNHREYYKTISKPVMSIRSLSDVENIFEYPMKEVIGEFQDVYFRNSIPYAIAFAILCLRLGDSKRPTIKLYGCDYNYPGQQVYEAGRCNLEYWLGRASAEGIQIDVATASTLMDANRIVADGAVRFYGYTDETNPQLVPDKDGRISFGGYGASAEILDDLVADPDHTKVVALKDGTNSK